MLIRWATVALGIGLAALEDRPTRLLVWGLPLVVYAALRTVRPLRYLTRGLESLIQVLVEVGLTLGVVVATGYWTSPYVFALATAILAAGFARGFGFALRTAITASVAVAIPYHLEAVDDRLIVSVQWAAELCLVGVVAGYSRRLFGEAEEQTLLARQANDLLAQLHDIAQTLPSSLDLYATVDEAMRDFRSVLDADAIAVLLTDPTSDTWLVAAAEGMRLPATVEPAALARGARSAAAEHQIVRSTIPPFFVPDAASATYVPLMARGRLVGIVAAETSRAPAVGAGTIAGGVELDAIAHRTALAIDNARWFTLLRRVGADEERTRIARDLHDRVGQSLAFVGFELDRISRAATGTEVEDELARLRTEVRRVVTEVRDTLYDLRTDVTEEQGLAATLAAYLDRVEERTGLTIELQQRETARLPLRHERELWRIAQEAITNAVRHADASTLTVRWRHDDGAGVLEVRDDGRGFPVDGVMRADAYGVRGMRERAAAIGGRLTIAEADGGGTVVRCEVRR